jgi:serine/threonine protein kinase
MQQIISLARDIAQGMNYLHNISKPIIHRDLKSSNCESADGPSDVHDSLMHNCRGLHTVAVLVDQNMTVKIADFGLSLILHREARDPEQKSSRRYGVFGTPEWMAPEVMQDREYNEKVDVYSYGIVLVELLSRSTPFHDK